MRRPAWRIARDIPDGTLRDAVRDRYKEPRVRCVGCAASLVVGLVTLIGVACAARYGVLGGPVEDVDARQIRPTTTSQPWSPPTPPRPTPPRASASTPTPTPSQTKHDPPATDTPRVRETPVRPEPRPARPRRPRTHAPPPQTQAPETQAPEAQAPEPPPETPPDPEPSSSSPPATTTSPPASPTEGPSKRCLARVGDLVRLVCEGSPSGD